MRGRKPQPLEVALARNNPGRRPLNFNAPKHETIDTTIPPELTGNAVAIAEWTRIVEPLAHGHCTVVDRTVLLAYCEKFAQWRKLEGQAATEDAVVRAPSGYPVPNPIIGLANKTYALMLKTASELGITPTSRTRIVLQPKRDDPKSLDEFSTFQRKRHGK
jgi:P27 family predicted phage terminase small subunit